MICNFVWVAFIKSIRFIREAWNIQELLNVCYQISLLNEDYVKSIFWDSTWCNKKDKLNRRFFLFCIMSYSSLKCKLNKYNNEERKIRNCINLSILYFTYDIMILQLNAFPKQKEKCIVPLLHYHKYAYVHNKDSTT